MAARIGGEFLLEREAVIVWPENSGAVFAGPQESLGNAPDERFDNAKLLGAIPGL